ncbi:hypothetical protein HDU91_001984 [Kappamyces sp. JEL0680]|nr:hypothetical protein HDU91_001984 [Kappamyces sp. JEL0680]
MPQTPTETTLDPHSPSNPLFLLRRDWEAAFHFQTLQGRGTEHLQQLMHSQFTFLEHVVLDLSKQCHSLQEQLVAERTTTRRLHDTIDELDRNHRQLHDQSTKKIHELEKSLQQCKQPLMELENRCAKLESTQSGLGSQISNLSGTVTAQNVSLQTQMAAKSDWGKDESEKMAAKMDVLRSELDGWKRGSAEDKEKEAKEKSALDQSLHTVQKSVESVRAEATREMSSLVQRVSDQLHEHTTQACKGIDKQLQTLKRAHQTEQQTMLGVIKTMGSNIATLRKELQLLDCRNMTRMEDLRVGLLQELKREIRGYYFCRAIDTVAGPEVLHDFIPIVGQ